MSIWTHNEAIPKHLHIKQPYTWQLDMPLKSISQSNNFCADRIFKRDRAREREREILANGKLSIFINA